ncbi:tRNA (adenosine(37)-N6)-threonylcarbamoyltransferase complex ATPase subunit type 1 TsaE [Aristophania vespae]|uniref:tRNA threonylcarbamoyladenosine biosynthesis protein TsaE n=1 Tax=Aristophania vespae TaxID=2697033 RepID=A0A6P1NEX1_9PROT|nr:tRNA (adenosine(37)-N6)-threonylcarbamoyltransferase complex ATPase subunit type 1 TsaE [Aristophania vespae]QHI95110.1 tRNA (adenosine(37)-N6)-threonylcarbamoyltransferase complex ATPase subunit type 1 TsaE [Aristophania vespae]
MLLTLSSPQKTVSLAAQLAARIEPGDCLALTGELGAGKSTFARGFLRVLSEDPALDVPSPSFSLVQPYDTVKGPVFHYDLWRLSGPDELYELAWDDACEAIMIVEWPQRAEELLPINALHLTFSYGEAENERKVLLEGWPEERLTGLAL